MILSTCTRVRYRGTSSSKSSLARLHTYGNEAFRRSSVNFTQLCTRSKRPNPGFNKHRFFSYEKRVNQDAYVAFGSNLGDRVDWIEKACNEMTSRGIRVKRTSSLWETEPMYVVDQGRFLNGVCQIETELQPIELLDQLQSIENDLGRKKIIDKGPRNIDLDILLYGDKSVHHPRLEIPHPGIKEREFVLKPLAELIPAKPLDHHTPWKVVQDFLNGLPSSDLTTITPLINGEDPIRCMKSSRKTHVMAIINLTPDSFSDGGEHLSDSSAMRIVDNYLSSGASILDFGGQSTKPGALEISSDTEIARIVPAIAYACNQRCKSKASKIAISVDTYRAKVADAAVNAGADIINDVSAGTLDPEMLTTMARLRKTVCLTHMRGTPKNMGKLTEYPSGLIPTIAHELLARVTAAEDAGIRRWRIILDPGIGFAKTTEQNLYILRNFDQLRMWPGLQGLPWLVGSSRKGFIGKITGKEVPRERVWGTAATVSAAIQGGADIVRVHDVEEMIQVTKMSDAIWRE